ncbi:LrgB family protein [Elizabethkingia sp. JS20170427COW]|uniref:LrgB family protein n=1 Tax=Elizabethkingia sp. JS20170427COW TaxID=2583851 RepID=UPI001110A142|nr:LrgB family protein [Elizabethkingia sp. JS20170427COW]QCX54076.1 LrgB family protein [Elizabethkingia sp. JS20170427COW]
MIASISNPAFFIALSVGAFYIGLIIQKKTKSLLFNPILIAMALIILFLEVFHIDYETYHENSKLIDFMLQPAIVCLAIPLYQQLDKIKQQLLPLLVSSVVGCVVGVISVVCIAWAMGAPKDIILSLAPKSVTTPIAMEVSNTIGGIPALTACVVIFVGIFGAIYGYVILKKSRVQSPIAQGLSIGMSAHAVGTAKSMDISASYGAFSTLGLIINGILTAVLTPYLVILMQAILGF